MLIHDATQLPNRRKWMRAEYNRAWQSGVFGETKVEFIDGEITEKTLRTPRRSTVIMLVSDALRKIFDADTNALGRQ